MNSSIFNCFNGIFKIYNNIFDSTLQVIINEITQGYSSSNQQHQEYAFSGIEEMIHNMWSQWGMNHTKYQLKSIFFIAIKGTWSHSENSLSFYLIESNIKVDVDEKLKFIFLSTSCLSLKEVNNYDRTQINVSYFPEHYK